MNNCNVLWFDMGIERYKHSHLFEMVSRKFNSRYFEYRDNDSVSSEIDHFEPTVIVFLYDIPTSNGLSQLDKTKRKYPSIPILMVTKTHSEALAIWALRARVWDYFVAPVSAADFIDVLGVVSYLKNNNVQRKRTNVTRLKASPSLKQKSPRKQMILRAISYIKKNYTKKLTATIVAEHIGMSSSHFSRQFQMETGMNFNNFLWSIRINMAKTLLIDPSISITSVCFDIGCTEPAYFTKKFRELESITPSEYQDNMAKTATAKLYSI